MDVAKPPVYNSLWQLRADSWSGLEEASERLAVAVTQERPTEHLVKEVDRLLDVLAPMEVYWAFPGVQTFQHARRLFGAGKHDRLVRLIAGINRALITDSYRNGGQWSAEHLDREPLNGADGLSPEHNRETRPYFEVLIVDDMTGAQERALREDLRRLRRRDDAFVYEVVVVPSFEDASMAVLLNFNLQACVIRRRFVHHSRHDLSQLGSFFEERSDYQLIDSPPEERAQMLARRIARLRPELDLYLMTEVSLEETAGRLSHHYRRVFHAREGLLELHLSILKGIEERYDAPFFEALRDYAHRPTGVFHALPISQGKSVVSSHWISDMVDFYGLEIFLAETSATCGGLDSLLEPTGSLRDAQELAAMTFGARKTFFVTNGTSTANKIVAQALLQPGDIVLVDRNCHQSHHYGLMMSGAHVTYLDAYPLNQYSMYGGVPLREIKRVLLQFRATGKLDRVKMLMLTNSTFDGIVYDVQRVMRECLAIKPDLIFLWDEAWFAFARFHPVYRPRTAMRAARTLIEKLRLPSSREKYSRYAERLAAERAPDEALLDRELLPDPARAGRVLPPSRPTRRDLLRQDP
jgi:arginine decarboxylase